MQAARFAVRMQRELERMRSEPPLRACVWPADDHLLTRLEAQIQGPDNTVYARGMFKLEIQIPDRYPFEPPSMRFKTPIYHPNIDTGGRICLDLLNMPPKGSWKPSLNISILLTSIGLLLAEPNADDGLMGEITAEYKHDRSSFDHKARQWTEKYATNSAGDRPPCLDMKPPESSNCNMEAGPVEVKQPTRKLLSVSRQPAAAALVTIPDSGSDEEEEEDGGPSSSSGRSRLSLSLALKKRKSRD